MSKLLATLAVGLFATSVFAQGTVPAAPGTPASAKTETKAASTDTKTSKKVKAHRHHHHKVAKADVKETTTTK